MRLSIIIPFYNVEQYIAQCLDSVYQQDIPEDDYEVVCVNDASPDHSREIVLEYQKKHHNLVLVEHEVNKKLGAARNTGRKIAQGKYIWNVDSDDMVVPNVVGVLLEQCEKNDLDVLCFAYDKYLPDCKTIERKEGLKRIGVTTGLDLIHQYGCSHLNEFCPVWRSLYRKAFLDDNNIYSPEINMGEDVPYAFKSIFLAKKMVLSDNKAYVYRVNELSLTGAKTILSPNRLYEKCFENTRLIVDVMRFIPANDKEIATSCKNVANYTFLMWKDAYLRMNYEDRMSFLSICRRFFRKDNNTIREVTSFKEYRCYLMWLLLGRLFPEKRLIC